jgi:glycosyltransferase involved in cell wall biosynthesis
MKIAFIHQPWSIIQPPVDTADSVALVTEQLARRLARRHKVFAYCRIGPGQPRVSEFAGVEYRHASVSLDRWVKFGMQQLDRRRLTDPLRPFFSSPLCYRQFIGEVIEDLAGQDCDIVHIQNFSQFAPLIRARLPDIKIVLHMHCEWLNQLDGAAIERRLRHCDLVLGVSRYLAEKVRRRFGHLSQRIGHLYNGADPASQPAPSESRAPEAPPLILYVGRLSPEKGIHILLDAFALVLKQRPDARLALVGRDGVPAYEMIVPFCDDPHVRELAEYYQPGSYSTLLWQKVDRLPPGSIDVFGQGLAHHELPSRYRAASVVVLPSIWHEPFGMPLVEAMAAGTATIATRAGAFPEIIEHGKTGLLVERDNCRELAQAILALLEDDELRRRIALAGYRRASRQFTWEAAADQLLAKYERVLRPRRVRISRRAAERDLAWRQRLEPAWPDHGRLFPTRDQKSSSRPA